MPRLQLGALALNVETHGDRNRPALLLAHPLGANSTLWNDVAPQLAAKYFVICPDARGHGASDAPAGAYRFDELGGDALQALDALGVDSVDMVGVSMGGALGQWLLIHAPHRVRKLVFANTASSFPPPDGWNARIRAARSGQMADLAAIVVRRWLTPDFEARNREKFGEIAAMIAQTPPLGYAGCCSALRDIDFRDALRAAPPHPVLVLVGDQDLSSPPSQGRRLAGALTNAELRSLPAAHLACVELRDQFWRIVAEFLA